MQQRPGFWSNSCAWKTSTDTVAEVWLRPSQQTNFWMKSLWKSKMKQSEVLPWHYWKYRWDGCRRLQLASTKRTILWCTCSWHVNFSFRAQCYGQDMAPNNIKHRNHTRLFVWDCNARSWSRQIFLMFQKIVHNTQCWRQLQKNHLHRGGSRPLQNHSKSSLDIWNLLEQNDKKSPGLLRNSHIPNR